MSTRKHIVWINFRSEVCQMLEWHKGLDGEHSVFRRENRTALECLNSDSLEQSVKKVTDAVLAFTDTSGAAEAAVRDKFRGSQLTGLNGL